MKQKCLNLFIKAEEQTTLLLKDEIKIAFSKLKGRWSFMSGNGCYFFQLNEQIVESKDLPKKLLKIINLLLKIEKDYNYFPSFDIYKD